MVISVTTTSRPGWESRAAGGRPAAADDAGASEPERSTTPGASRWRCALANSTAAATCVGVVPQHPPTMLAPASRSWRAYRAKYSESMSYSNRAGATRRGSPAFGWTLSGRSLCSRSSRRTSRDRCGPRVQFRPSVTMPEPATAAATSRGVCPLSVRPSAPNVAWAITGILAVPMAISTASANSSRYPNVSSRMMSAPASASICSRSAAARSRGSAPRRCWTVTVGDTDPATSTPVPPRTACRAIRTPARLISSTRSPYPCSASLARLAPNVLVWMMSTPALM